jgi:hypothetical protein
MQVTSKDIPEVHHKTLSLNVGLPLNLDPLLFFSSPFPGCPAVDVDVELAVDVVTVGLVNLFFSLSQSKHAVGNDAEVPARVASVPIVLWTSASAISS